MTFNITLSIISIIVLILTIRRAKIWPIVLTCGLTIGILIPWTGVDFLIIWGLLIYMISSIAISIYGLTNNNLSKVEKTVVALTGFWEVIKDLFSIMHWPYANAIRYSLIIPIILYFILIINGLNKKDEFGFMTILNLKFLLRLAMI